MEHSRLPRATVNQNKGGDYDIPPPPCNPEGYLGGRSLIFYGICDWLTCVPW